MRALKLIPFLFVLSLLVDQIVLVPGQAEAKDCCKTCPCTWMCTCPGVGICPWFACLTDEPEKFEAWSSDKELQVAGLYSSSPASSPQPIGIDRLISRTSLGTCARNSDTYIRKFFSAKEDHLKYDATFLRYNTNQDETTEVLQISMNAQR
jgi:hypothetical protein